MIEVLSYTSFEKKITD